MKPDFDPIARPYRWLEYLSFGPMLERCRFYYLPELAEAKRALILGDGDGRFLARLLTVNSQIHADVIDLSPAMLRLLQKRAAETGAPDRITLHCVDAREFTPKGKYDLIVTHFFLDCFTTDELHALAARIDAHLCPKALWVVSEFAIPSGTMSLPAKAIVRSLYAAFRILTGLKVRQLPDYKIALAAAGLTLIEQKFWLKGLLVTELWQTTGNQQ
jgi:cyclopropane fatty-acyl-phospholipid synthase-like methyltransferase